MGISVNYLHYGVGFWRVFQHYQNFLQDTIGSRVNHYFKFIDIVRFFYVSTYLSLILDYLHPLNIGNPQIFLMFIIYTYKVGIYILTISSRLNKS
jgi:hypothetical protein